MKEVFCFGNKNIRGLKFASILYHPFYYPVRWLEKPAETFLTVVPP